MSLISCIKSLLKKAKTTLPGNDSGIAQSVQVQYMNKVTVVESITPAGLAHNPLPNSIAVLFNIQAAEDNMCAIVTDQLNRIKNLKAGETVIYNTKTKANLFFDDLGNANLNPGIPLGIFNINYPLSVFNGDVIFAGIPPNQILISGASPVYGIGLDNGELLIGSTGSAPIAANLTQGSGIIITNLPGQIIISFSGIFNFPVSIGSLSILSFNTPGIVHNDTFGLLSSSLIVDADVDSSAAIAYSKLNLSNSIVNADINASAAIVDTKLATISTSGKVANSATTATSSNIPNTIVLRDASGGFIADDIVAGSLSLDGISAISGVLKESSFTPTMFDTSGNQPVYTTQLGKYLRVANTVFIDLKVTISSKTGITAGDNIRIGNLPYIIGTGFNNVGIVLAGSSDFTAPLLSVSLRAIGINTQSYIELTWINNTGMTSMATWSQFSSTGTITINITYTV